MSAPGRTGAPAASGIPLGAPSAAHVETLAALYDGITVDLLEARGVAAGWRCWEVGAGGPSVPAWLAQRVGPTGHVLATDVDVTHLEASPTPGVEVRRHTLGTDPAPVGDLDLVHSRLAIDHVRDRDTAVTTMIDALRPGGWLVAECGDPALQTLACPDETGPPEELANRVREAIWSMNAPRRRPPFARTLPRVMRERGLVEVGALAHFWLSGPAANRLHELMIGWARPHVVAAGRITEQEIDRHLADLAEGRVEVSVAPVVSAWGRVPGGGG